MLQHKKIKQNQHGTDFFVGDIHGEFELLDQSLLNVSFDKSKDRLFAVGDLIDRGPQSESCLELLHQPWFFSVLGNHEAMFLNGKHDPSIRQLHIKNGGTWINSISEEKHCELEALIRNKMPLAMTIATDTGKIGVIHAAAPADWLDLEQEQELESWDKFLHSAQQYNQALTRTSKKVIGIDFVIHGHVNCDYVEYGENQVWIDTLLRSGKLTVIALNELINL